jgi:hypothetical protein
MNQALGKTGKSPVFPQNSKEAVPKAEVLEQPQVIFSLHKDSAQNIQNIPCGHFYRFIFSNNLQGVFFRYR